MWHTSQNVTHVTNVTNVTDMTNITDLTTGPIFFPSLRQDVEDIPSDPICDVI